MTGYVFYPIPRPSCKKIYPHFDLFEGFAVDDGPTMGFPPFPPPPALADPQPLPPPHQQPRDIGREGVTVGTFQVHEGQVWSNGILLHARVSDSPRVSSILQFTVSNL